uniref:(S)-2-haloacid dehalogenase n=1 Tax=Pseudomonas putida TaxID=303 RepID=HADL_PSEPU|nr:RecName: Full=(S)-2-haloacid dehalogenase; AltName: Full=2-haloalkanoic acid dehalogenase; AltName: Full=Halocarboxylic acid halidohydrolase; AltName: Full=L-2-haloacid dehalogenase [Pseudomonas putida]AAA25832.1 L-2-haloalkanoate dehalogenase [Pseudomonas putida]
MKNIQGIVFDLYGTLYDVHSVVQACEEVYPGQGDAISRLWRQKQLEYTWLRSLMGRYVNFEKATEDALRFTCTHLGLSLDDETHQRLSDAYLHLTPYADTADAVRRLKAAGLPLGIISNGSHCSIEQVVTNSEMNWAFDQLISVEDVQVFKPDSRVYSLAEKRMGFPKENILFVSSNAWDASAASNFGFPVCWINRQNGAFDELDAKPTHVVRNLAEMSNWLVNSLD